MANDGAGFPRFAHPVHVQSAPAFRFHFPAGQCSLRLHPARRHRLHLHPVEDERYAGSAVRRSNHSPASHCRRHSAIPAIRHRLDEGTGTAYPAVRGTGIRQAARPKTRNFQALSPRLRLTRLLPTFNFTAYANLLLL